MFTSQRYINKITFLNHFIKYVTNIKVVLRNIFLFP